MNVSNKISSKFPPAPLQVRKTHTAQLYKWTSAMSGWMDITSFRGRMKDIRYSLLTPSDAGSFHKPVSPNCNPMSQGTKSELRALQAPSFYHESHVFPISAIKVKSVCFRVKPNWIWIPVPPLASHVLLAKFRNLSEPLFLHLLNGDKTSTHLLGLLWKERERRQAAWHKVLNKYPLLIIIKIFWIYEKKLVLISWSSAL